MVIENLTVAEIVGGVAVALITLAMGLQAILWRWKGTQAETEVIDMLRDEVKRLAQQNVTLTTTLNKLQSELVQLHAENGRLKVEIERLNNEITRLRQVMSQPHRGDV